MKRRNTFTLFILGTGLLPVLLLLLALNENHIASRELQDVNRSGSLRFCSLWLYGATHAVPAEDWHPMWTQMELIRRCLRVSYPNDVRRTDQIWNLAEIQLSHTGRIDWPTANALREAANTLTASIEQRAQGGALRVSLWLTLGIAGLSALLGRSLLLVRRTEQAEAEHRRLADILEATPDFVSIADPHGRIVYHNRAFRELGGLAPGALLRDPHIADCHPGWATRKVLDDAFPIIREQGVWTGETALLDANGHEVPVFQTILAHRDVAGNVERYSTIARDISAIRQVENDLRQAERQYHAIYENTMEGILQATPDGRILSANPALARLLGYSSPLHLMQEVTDIGQQMYADPTDRQRLLALIRQDGSATAFEAPLRRCDGGTVWASMNVRNVRDESGELLYLEGTLEDITERRAAVDALRQAEEKFRSIYENAIEGISQSTPQGRFITVNPAMARILGYESPRQLIEEMTDIGSQLYADHAARAGYTDLLRQEGRAVAFEAQLRRRDGSLIWASMNARAVHNAAGELLYFEGTVEDVTERREDAERLKDYALVLEFQQAELKKANAELETLAMTDGLTGLCNHRTFQQKLAENFQTSQRHTIPLSLLLLDVDCFKQYNDTFGHPAGDFVLRKVATLLQENIRSADIAARYGGEEFAVILPYTDLAGALSIAECIREAVSEADWPQRSVTISGGVTTLCTGIDGPAAMVASADMALYASKQSGRNRMTVDNVSDPPGLSLAA